jgi:uncharacterized membrane protein (DUF4010 family)
MAIGPYFPQRSRNQDQIEIAGSFAPNAAGAVDNTVNEGIGFQVARTGVGQFTITFKEKFIGLIAFLAMLQLNALADSDVQLGAYSQANKTVIINVKTAGVAADIAANANNRIHFVAKFWGKTPKPRRGNG